MATTGKSATASAFGEIMVAPEAAEYLRIPKSTLYKLAQEGKIPACKVGKHWRFLRDEIYAWLLNNGRGKYTGVQGYKEPVLKQGVVLRKEEKTP